MSDLNIEKTVERMDGWKTSLERHYSTLTEVVFVDYSNYSVKEMVELQRDFLIVLKAWEKLKTAYKNKIKAMGWTEHNLYRLEDKFMRSFYVENGELNEAYILASNHLHDMVYRGKK